MTLPTGGHGTVDECRGSSLIGLLVVLMVLGGMAVAIPLATMGTTAGTHSLESTSSLDGRHSLPAVNAAIHDAAVAACRADYSVAEQAVAEYQAENGSLPTRVQDIQALLRDPLSTAQFSITIDPGHPGRLQVRTGSYPAVDGPGNCLHAG